MQVKRTNISDTKVKLSISASQAYLAPIKEQVLMQLSQKVKLPGFREGKAPLNLVEKNVDPQALQTEFLDFAMGQLYNEAIKTEKLRTFDRPQVTLKKFVPFSDVEFEAEVEVLSPVKLGDYKKIKKSLKTTEVTDKEVNDVVENLRNRMAEKKEVKRLAKNGDEVIIDFEGFNTKKEAIKGADGKDFPLLLGSDTFIPGFEKNLIGMKAGDKKTFDLTFPKDYRATSLAGTKVNFKVSVNKVNELVKPDANDEFAQKVGDFKTLLDLKADVKKQLELEKANEAQTKLETEIITELRDKSTASIPEALIADQTTRELAELKQSLAGQGLTYDEFLELEGMSAQVYEEKVVKPRARQKIKTSLVLAEVSEAEGLEVAPEELAAYIDQLRAQYTDEAMQAEFEKPEVQQDLASRLLTEKTINALVGYATQ